MSIYVLKYYVEQCIKAGIEPTFEGLNKYYKEKVLNKISFELSLIPFVLLRDLSVIKYGYLTSSGWVFKYILLVL